MKKRLIFLFLLSFNVLVSGQENPESYKEINDSLVISHYSKYKIDIPDSWFSYITDPGLVAHSPIEFKDKLKPNDSSVGFIIWKNVFKRKTLEKSLKSFLLRSKGIHPRFKYKLLEAEHKLYGKYYIVKYGINRKEGLEIVMTCILNWKKQNYTFFYSSLEADFDTYLEDAIAMINSFKIKEPIQIQE